MNPLIGLLQGEAEESSFQHEPKRADHRDRDHQAEEVQPNPAPRPSSTTIAQTA